MSLSLNGIVDYHKLETVFGQLVERLDSQNKRIESLEKELERRPSPEQYAAYQNSLDERLQALEKRTRGNEQNVQTLLDKTAKTVDKLVLSTAALAEATALKLDTSDFARMRSDFATLMDAALADIRNTKANKDLVHNLEDTQRRVLQEVVAVQGVLACKVDRVEVPLLNMAAEKIESLLGFKKDAIPRIVRLEADIATCSKAIASKENTSAVVQRMQSIYETLQTKADRSWIEKGVAARATALEELTSGYSQLESGVAALKGVTSENSDSLRRTTERVAAAAASVTGMESKCSAAMHAIASKVDTDRLDSQLSNVKKATELLLDRIAQKSVADQKYQSAQVSELNQRITQIKAAQLSIDKKVDLAIRFVNWFTDSKLDGSSGGGGGVGGAFDMPPGPGPASFAAT